jgi:transaldolase
MKENPLRKLEALGQSIWLDLLDRGMLRSGEFRRLMEEDGISGVTSNPKTFSDAVVETDHYDKEVRDLVHEGLNEESIAQRLAFADVQQAADLLRPIYDRTEGTDGFVSLEVSPHLAYDTAGTVAQARQFWKAVDRPNLFIKVPGTRDGVPAIQQLISEGINVNVTLLFGLERYREVVQAYIAGLNARAVAGQRLVRVASVASFFLSRIDVLVDPLLEKVMQQSGPEAELAKRLIGEVAIASAKMAFRIHREIFGGDRFGELAAKGARPQKLLWASTSTKNPNYSDVKYVEPLIGADTINTLPLKTIEAYRDHGRPEPRLAEGLEQAEEVFDLLPNVGIDPAWISQQLEKEGVEKFAKPYDALLTALKEQYAGAAH